MPRPKCSDHPAGGYYTIGNGVRCRLCDKVLRFIPDKDHVIRKKRLGSADYKLKTGKYEGLTVLEAVKRDEAWANWCLVNGNQYLRMSVALALESLK